MRRNRFLPGRSTDSTNVFIQLHVMCPACDGLGEHAYRISNPTCPNAMVKGFPNTVQSPFRVGTSSFLQSQHSGSSERTGKLGFDPNQLTVAEQALREIQTRLDFWSMSDWITSI